jgi:hypothetical protein
MFSDQYLAGFKAARGLETAVKAAYDAQSWAKHAGDGGGISGAVAERICQYLEPLLDHDDYARAEEMIYECVDAGEDGASEHDDQYSSRGHELDAMDRRRYRLGRSARDDLEYNRGEPDERLARDRDYGKDQPPAFKGMPRTGSGPGAGIDGRYSQDRYHVRSSALGSSDRRGRAMDSILATGPAMAFDKKLARRDRARKDFELRFPETKRIGFR